jgi:flagellar hook-associated protein 2
MASTSGVDLSVSGLASGMDWKTIVSELATAERAPETQWQTNQSTITQKNNAFGTIKSYLNNLQADVKKLQDPTLFTNRSAAISNSTNSTGTADSSVATVSAATGATTGTFAFSISQLATAASINGKSNISQSLVPDGIPADVTIGTAGFATAITEGTFTINGAQVTVSSSDSLQQVFDNISTATSGAVTASYDATKDEIKLASTSAINLGSAADTSNFLQVAQLYNNSSGSVASTSALGHAKLTATLASAGLTTAVAGDTNGDGDFSINGVTINYNTGTDSLQDVLDRINGSTAGVNASYDSLNNRFTLQNKTTGDVGISLQDGTGNLLTATGLSTGGTFVAGQNLLYTVNGNAQVLQSRSNTINGDSSTITGLSLTALKTGDVSVTVGSDTSAVTAALQSFVNDYNNVQSYITTQSASSTDATGKVTAGLLTGDMDAADIASSLRSAGFSPVAISGLSATFSQLANMGITSNGQDNTITLDTTTLSTALANNLTQVKSFFSDATNGWATQLNTYLTNTVGDNGSIASHQAALTTQSTAIDTQIANLEKQITADTATWTTSFQNMETAMSQTNQELTYLNQSVTNGTL